MSKAFVLPVNVLVIVAVATIASLGLIGVYGVGYNPFSMGIGLESVKNTGCRKLVMGGCKVNASDILLNYDVNKDGLNDTRDNLLELCKRYFGRNDEKSCKQMCGCVGGSVSTGTSTSDFSVAVVPISNSIVLGSSATPSVNVGGFSTGPITLSLGSTCPSGATCSFSQNNLPPSFSSVLTITNAAVGGPYAMTITGTNGTRTKTETYSLTVNAVGGFTFTTSVSPSTDSSTQGTPFGRTSAITVTRTSAAGTEKQVDVTSSGTITNGMVISSFVPCTPNPTCSGTLTISTGATTPAGIYIITVTGTSGATTSSATYRLTVNPPGPCECIDGTVCGQCSSVEQPSWCDSSGNLISNQCNDPHNCPCSGGQTCNADGSCSTAVCSCDWINYACGGGGCTIFIDWCGRWERCQCNIPNCGTCGGSSDDTLFCNNGVPCGLIRDGCVWVWNR